MENLAPVPRTTECPTCHEQIPVDTYEAMQAMYGSHGSSTLHQGSRLAYVILRDFKRSDEPITESDKRRRAQWAIEDWLDCRLPSLIDAVSHYELDKDSVWCERCNARVDEAEAITYRGTGQIEFLCGDCYVTATSRPEDEEAR